jgi:hypothetical protein
MESRARRAAAVPHSEIGSLPAKRPRFASGTYCAEDFGESAVRHPPDVSGQG